MSSLAYGLNLPKRGPPSSAKDPGQGKRRTLFDDDVDNEEDEHAAKVEPVQCVGNGPSLASPNRKWSAPRSDQKHRNLSSKRAAAAQEVNAEDYDYDGVYDSLKAAKEAKPQSPAGPRYMQHLMNAEEVRKRDQLRAKETILQKEREAEGEAFADKEKFVTAAYKAQQEEVQRLEEEERKKEERDAKRQRRDGPGITAFRRGLMEREEARHQAALKAVQENAGKELTISDRAEKSERELGQEKGILLNEEGQVIDKRQMLSAGLNIKAKPQPSGSFPAREPAFKESAAMAILSGRGGSKAALRERQSRMLESQLVEAAERAAKDEKTEREALQRAAKTKKTESEVSSARERYLQRKREGQAAEGAES